MSSWHVSLHFMLVSSQQFCVPNALDCLNCVDFPQSPNFGKRCLELQLLVYSSFLYIFVFNAHVMMFVPDCLFSYPSKKCDLIPLHCPRFMSFCCHWHWHVLVIVASLSFQCAFTYALRRVITFFIKMLVPTGVTHVSQCIAKFHNHFAYI
jgi:hypothetical protein